METMTIEQAMAIIAQVCANHTGTLKDHQVIQQALQVLEQATKPVSERTAQAKE